MNVNKISTPIPTVSNLANLATALQSCMLVDRHALRRKFRDVVDLQKLKIKNNKKKTDISNNSNNNSTSDSNNDNDDNNDNNIIIRKISQKT